MSLLVSIPKAIPKVFYFKNFAKLAVFDRNLPFFPAAPLRRPPSYAKQRPGVWMRSSSLWRVSSFHFLSLHRIVHVLVFWQPSPRPEARDAVFFGLEDSLYTAASDSEDFEAVSLAAGCASRSAGYFPSSATVEGKRHFRFSLLRVAAGCRHCTHRKGCPALSPHISISCPCLYGLIGSCLHARGRCELSSASAGCMSLPSGRRSEWGPRVGIPLDMSHSATSVGLPPYLEGPAGSVTLDSSYDPVWLHTPICWAPPVPPPPFRRGSS